MKPLAEKALASWRRGEIIFYPKKWEHTYQHWMENIRDWCISRQLWWGHRIPAWNCHACGEISVSRNDLTACSHCGSTNIEQDPDVLDTWFSSWLWPFSTLGWGNGETLPSSPTPHPDFSRYYPTTALVTAYDIIFFWVSRMIMAGLEFTGKAPFRDIYIHGLVRDKLGRKMSKSLGNGLDPLELVDEFGADAMKFTLAFMCAQGQDLLVDKESFKMGSKFANKVWNASRYILMNLEGRNLVPNSDLLPVDKWIYSRLNSTAQSMEEAFLSSRFNDAAQTAYEYFWNDFCDWYVEATKLSVKTGSEIDQDSAEKDRAATILLDVLAESLRLLHPLLPFVTEEIYGKLPNTDGLLITAPYPQFTERRCYADEERQFAFLQEFVRKIRTLRSECTITQEKKLRVIVRLGGEHDPPAEAHQGRGSPPVQVLKQNEGLVKLLAGIGEMELTAASATDSRPAGSIGLVGSGFEAFIFIAEAVDIAALKQKFNKDLERDRKFIEGLRAKLANEQFVQNAPPELVAAEKIKLEEGLARTGKIELYLRDL
jgi:valyl-tRNA synthetase